MRKISHAFSLILLFVFAGSHPGWVRAAPPPPEGVEALLQQDAGGQAEISTDPRTGLARFIAIPGGAELQPESKQGLWAAQSAANAFTQRYGALFGLSDPAAELTVARVSRSGAGNFTRYQQQREGIPVLGGELIIQTDARGNLLSFSGRVFSGDMPEPAAAVAAETATATALEAVNKYYGYSAELLETSAAELVIYDPHLLDSKDGRPAGLVWKVEVTGKETLPLRELFLIDAASGATRLHFNQADTALSRVVYDYGGIVDSIPSLARSEGGAASAISDVNYAYDYSGDTYNFYSNIHGRNSIDNAGMQLISNTRYCPDAAHCQYENAFWDGSQMVYGTGFPFADDVVAHELTHGVTEYESNLFYYMQSGAINESLSDIWGEFVDLSNGKGTDTAATRWQMGEDLPASIGLIRDMEDPTIFGDPDRMTSANYYCQYLDNGGVHRNSGVLNKAAFLMVDGGSFNGQTITGIGITKTAKVLYEVQTNLLTSGSEYSDLYRMIPQACSSLVGTNGITAADCSQVTKAVVATEMNLEPTSCPSSTVTPVCSAGEIAAPVYSRNFENGLGDWASQEYVDSYPSFDRWSTATGYAPSGIRALWGNDYSNGSGSINVSDSAAAMTSGVALSSGFFTRYYLHFTHAYDFDSYASTYYDGGIVEYKIGNGSWFSMDSFAVVNGPDKVLWSGFGNPLGGKTAFGDTSHGYKETQYTITSLAGQTVSFRFRMGTDISVSYGVGWNIDDVTIYGCGTFPYSVFLPVTRR